MTKLKNKYLPDSISGKSLVITEKLEPKHSTKASLTSYAETASDGQIAYSTDTGEFFGITDGILKKLDLQSGFDIINSASISNDTSAYTEITTFNVGTSNAFEALIKVKVTASSNKTETIQMLGDYNGSDWDISIESINESGVDLDVNSDGILVYKSPNYPGFVSAIVEFKVKTNQAVVSSTVQSISAASIYYNDDTSRIGNNIIDVQEAIETLDSQLDIIESRVEAEINFYEEITFNNVSTINVDYAPYPSRPVVEIWIAEGGDFYLAEADVTYDTTSETITVSFNGSIESGYLVLK